MEYAVVEKMALGQIPELRFFLHKISILFVNNRFYEDEPT